MSNTSRNWIEQNVPSESINVPWTHNRLVADYSYRQDNFKRTIPNHVGPLPNVFTPKKRIIPPPAFMNPPHLTQADKNAKAYLAQKELREKIQTYSENLEVLQPGTQPWKMPQVPVKNSAEKVHSDAPSVGQNFFVGRKGPPDTAPRIPRPVTGDYVLSHGMNAPPQNVNIPMMQFVTANVVHHPVEAAKEARMVGSTMVTRKAKVVAPHLPYDQIWGNQVEITSGVAHREDMAMSIRGDVHVPTVQGRRVQTLGPLGGIVTQRAAPIRASAELVVPRARDVQMEDRPPGYTAFEEQPPVYPFSGSSTANPRNPLPRGRRPPPPRYHPPLPRTSIPHTSVTSGLPGRTRIAGVGSIPAPTRNLNAELYTPIGSSRERDPGWFLQGLDDVPTLPTKRKGRPDTNTRGKRK